jgi:hypothetical protein
MQMTYPTERGLFERILKFLDENTIEGGWYNDDLLKTICTEYEQQQEQQLAAAREEVEGLRADAKRYQILKDDYIEYKPAGYDGCSFGRFDLCWKSDTSDLSKAIDAALTAPLPEKNDHE